MFAGRIGPSRGPRVWDPWFTGYLRPINEARLYNISYLNEELFRLRFIQASLLQIDCKTNA